MLFRIFLFAMVAGLLQLTVVHAEDLNPVVGRAGDFVLREADVGRLIGYQPPQVRKMLQENPAQRVEFVRQLLLTMLVAEKARSAAFEKRPEVREQLGYVVDQFLAGEYLEKVVTANVVVPEDDIKKYYNEHEKDFLVPESARARHIFIEVPKDAPPEVKGKALAKAEEVLERLRKGDDFSKLAKEFSQDADTAAKGGEIGWVSPGKTNSEVFEKAVFSLKAGETSGVVETPFGFHILRVDERREQRTATLDEAREYITDRLEGELAREKAGEFLEKLSKDKGLKVDVGKSDKSEGKGPESGKE